MKNVCGCGHHFNKTVSVPFDHISSVRDILCLPESRPLYWGGGRIDKGGRSHTDKGAEPEPKELLLSFSGLPGTKLEVSLSTYSHTSFTGGRIRKARQALGTN